MFETDYKNITLNSKKIIAREVLLLLSGIALVIIIFLAIWPYNYFKHNSAYALWLKEEPLIKLKYHIIDSLASSQESHSKRLHDFLKRDYNYSADYEMFLSEMKDITKKERLYQNLKNNNDISSHFEEFDSHFFSEIEKDRLSFLDKKWKQTKIDSLTLEINQLDSEREKLLSQKIGTEPRLIKTRNREEKTIYSEQMQLTIDILKIAFLIFVFRYLYIGIKWSIKILKQ